MAEKCSCSVKLDDLSIDTVAMQANAADDFAMQANAADDFAMGNVAADNVLGLSADP